MLLTSCAHRGAQSEEHIVGAQARGELAVGEDTGQCRVSRDLMCSTGVSPLSKSKDWQYVF